jgi:hypothetical protein
MADPCGGFTKTISSGSICNPGPIKGAILFEEKQAAITNANAALEATWDAFMILDQPARGMLVLFDIIEPGEDTPDEVEFSDGSKGIASISKGIDKYKIVSSTSGKKTIYGQLKNGRELYVAWITQFGFLVGKDGSVANTFDFPKYRVYSTIERAQPKDFNYVNMHFDALEDWEESENIVDPDFDPTALSRVQNMTFTLSSVSQTSMVVTAKTLDKVGITSLDTVGAGQFTLYNNDTSAAVVVTGIVRSGSAYTLSYASQTIGHSITVGYNEPSTSTEYYDLLATVDGTVA